jgi:hypothetical protein
MGDGKTKSIASLIASGDEEEKENGIKKFSAIVNELITEKDVKRDVSVRQKRVVHGRQHLAGGEMVTFSTGLIWVVSVASGERQSVDPGERRSYQPHRTQRTDQVRSPPSQTCLLRVQTDGEQPRRRSETSEVSPQ